MAIAPMQQHATKHENGYSHSIAPMQQRATTDQKQAQIHRPTDLNPWSS